MAHARLVSNEPRSASPPFRARTAPSRYLAKQVRMHFLYVVVHASHFAPPSHPRHRLQVASHPVAHADPGGEGVFSSVTTGLTAASA